MTVGHVEMSADVMFIYFKVSYISHLALVLVLVAVHALLPMLPLLHTQQGIVVSLL